MGTDSLVQQFYGVMFHFPRVLHTWNVNFATKKIRWLEVQSLLVYTVYPDLMLQVAAWLYLEKRCNVYCRGAMGIWASLQVLHQVQFPVEMEGNAPCVPGTNLHTETNPPLTIYFTMCSPTTSSIPTIPDLTGQISGTINYFVTTAGFGSVYRCDWRWPTSSPQPC